MRKRICLISFYPIHRDGRVLRQVKYLSKEYDVSVLAYGSPDPTWQHVEWLPLVRKHSWVDTIFTALLLILGIAYHPVWNFLYWHRPHYRQALAYLTHNTWDGYYANEWAAVPLAVMGARKDNVPAVFDAHEYYPLQNDDSILWRLFYAPMICYLLERYLPYIAAAITVCQPIADRYKQEFGIDPLVVMNAPEYRELPFRLTSRDTIRLLHHGNAQWNRHLEVMITALPLLRKEFELHFVLVDEQSGYIDFLRRQSETVAPGRVFFHAAVPPGIIVPTISQYDIEIILIRPINYNFLMSLPNKLFEALHAGLALCVGPSPAMVDVVEKYGTGWISATFEAEGLANILNRLTVDEINSKRQAAHEAAKELNADRQLARVQDLYARLLNTRHSL